MENWKKCRFDFQTCLHSNQDYSVTVKDISFILHNLTVPKLDPFPRGATKKIVKKMCKTYVRYCILAV